MVALALSKRWSAILALVLIALAPITLSFGSAYFIMRQEMRQNAFLQIGAQTQLVASYLENKLQSDEMYAVAHADRPSLHEALVSRDMETLVLRLEEIVDKSQNFELAILTDVGGQILLTYPFDIDAHGQDVSEYSWFRGATENLAPFYASYLKTQYYPFPHGFYLGLPILSREGVTLGFLGLRMRADYLESVFLHLVFPDVTSSVMDINNMLLHHPEYETHKVFDFSEVPAVKALEWDGTGTGIYLNTAGTFLSFTGYQFIPRTNWSVILETPLTKVYEPIFLLSGAFLSLAVLAAMGSAMIGNLIWRTNQTNLKSNENLKKKDQLEKEYSSVLAILNTDDQSVQALCDSILGKLSKTVSFEIVVLHLLVDEKLTPALSSGVKLPEIAGDFADEAARQNSILRIRDIPDGGGMALTTASQTLRPYEIAALPLSYADKVLGVLEIASILPIRQTDFDLLSKIAPHIAVSIATMRAKEQLSDYASKLSSTNSDLLSLNDALSSVNYKLKIYQQEIIESNHKLDYLSKAKSDFLANMSHELRTPLNSILGFSEALQDQLFGTLSERQMEYIGYIYDSGRHLLDLINDILDVSKIESGTQTLEISRLSLKRILSSTVLLFKEKAMKNSLSLIFIGEKIPDVEFDGDERKIKQILLNLLSNAVKFTPAGGSVFVTAELTGTDLQSISISVEDTGIGVKQDDLPKLFIEFSQVDSSLSKRHEGTGLGLALSRKIAEAHHGQLTVVSEFGKGSVFTLELPLGYVEAAYASSYSGVTAVASLSGKKILIIEDNPVDAETLRYMLEGEGALCKFADNAYQGLDEAMGEKPDLIILDLMLPLIDGFNFLRLLHEKEQFSETPVVLYTVMSLSSYDISSLRLNVYSIVQKGTISNPEFVQILVSAIGS